ncbi:hypothetical protein [Candidatus Lokiarchaeum ossiferum]|uniref:hypothetical protein n=1 Tax=Candidatus Lokiarchaeum ossiferum TaxID=2951803 RepID=UPI00352C2765
MGIIKIRVVSDTHDKKTISISKTTKTLKGFYDLYRLTAKNMEKHLKRDLKLFELEFSHLHFSDAEFTLQTPLSIDSMDFFKDDKKIEEEVYAKPYNDIVKIFDLAKKGSEESKQSFDELKQIIPDNSLRQRIIESALSIVPLSDKENINFEYSSSKYDGTIEYQNISSKIRTPIISWKQFNKAEIMIEKEIRGVVVGIVTTTENKYIIIESEDDTNVRCYYTDKIFNKDLTVSDLRVTKDIIIAKGIYLSMANSDDKLVNITEIQKIKTDFDFSSEEEIKEISDVSSEGLKEFLDNEPDLYTLEDLKVKFE